MRFTFYGARLVDAGGDLPSGAITIEGARIVAAGSAEMEAEVDAGAAVDASGMIVTPGFVDVHTHGGGGFNLHTANVDEILAYAGWVPSTGVTSFLIGVVGTPQTLPEAQLRAAVAATRTWKSGQSAGGQGASPRRTRSRRSWN
jgi:N-acetylglucosamine-6-phosphate deacetylase